jgi:hypothetical protein
MLAEEKSFLASQSPVTFNTVTHIFTTLMKDTILNGDTKDAFSLGEMYIL